MFAKFIVFLALVAFATAAPIVDSSMFCLSSFTPSRSCKLQTNAMYFR